MKEEGVSVDQIDELLMFGTIPEYEDRLLKAKDEEEQRKVLTEQLEEETRRYKAMLDKSSAVNLEQQLKHRNELVMRCLTEISQMTLTANETFTPLMNGVPLVSWEDEYEPLSREEEEEEEEEEDEMVRTVTVVQEVVRPLLSLDDGNTVAIEFMSELSAGDTQTVRAINVMESSEGTRTWISTHDICELTSFNGYDSMEESISIGRSRKGNECRSGKLTVKASETSDVSSSKNNAAARLGRRDTTGSKQRASNDARNVTTTRSRNLDSDAFRPGDANASRPPQKVQTVSRLHKSDATELVIEAYQSSGIDADDTTSVWGDERDLSAHDSGSTSVWEDANDHISLTPGTTSVWVSEAAKIESDDTTSVVNDSEHSTPLSTSLVEFDAISDEFDTTDILDW